MSEKTKTGLLAAAIVTGLLGVAALLGLSLSAPRATPGRPAAAVAGDPWPECAAVRDWLDQNINDRAAGWEAVAWQERLVAPDGTNVRLKYRAKNSAGAWQVETRLLTVQGGKVIAHSPPQP